MTVLQVEHKIQSFEGWKKAFESDPIGRKKAGVKRYRILRPTDDDHYVVIHLEFENMQDAVDALAALQKLWEKVEGVVMFDPKTRIFELAESVDI